MRTVRIDVGRVKHGVRLNILLEDGTHYVIQVETTATWPTEREESGLWLQLPEPTTRAVVKIGCSFRNFESRTTMIVDAPKRTRSARPFLKKAFDLLFERVSLPLVTIFGEEDESNEGDGNG